MQKNLIIGCSITVLGLFVSSCNDNEDYSIIQSIDRIKIDSVNIVNDTMDVFALQSIRTYSTYPSRCEGFYGYDYIYEDHSSRRITAYRYFRNGPCTQNTYVGVNQINFSPQHKGTYRFSFWNGDDQWIVKTIVVE
ncbi:hypothetical protein D1631_10160 [Chryseobacterium nematophagum]|uniref:Lipoprotein n=1 Tax=Chryseobacterium nematophagum TaxID=2305228 RepID=A0A3M7TH18_9FLAO|nr:hypothetical protein [Chryseobacterium nematophagum]RNA62266.1 hypothetical protein D1631_10160 [Chryseobacterium nematophagum]